MDGWYEVDLVECYACSAVDSRMASEKGQDHTEPKVFPMVRDTRDYSVKPLPPLPTKRKGD